MKIEFLLNFLVFFSLRALHIFFNYSELYFYYKEFTMVNF